MNPFTDSKPGSGPAPCNDSRSPSLSSPPVPQVIPTNHSSPPCDASSDQDGGQDVVRSPVSPLPSFAGLGLRSELEVTPDTPPPVSVPNPYRAPIPRLDSCQVSIIIPSPDLRPSPLPPQCPEDSPDLECAICLSDFNNIFRCPKMLHCKHTFCLECLARINVNSSEPNAIQCPLCRRLTSLPNLGLPRLPTDSDVLSYLPSAMQRVYSIRFLRNKGKLKVKRSSESHQRWGQGSSRDANRTLNVGLPISSVEGHRRLGAVGRARPQYCFLTCVLTTMVVLIAVILFLLPLLLVPFLLSRWDMDQTKNSK